MQRIATYGITLSVALAAFVGSVQADAPTCTSGNTFSMSALTSTLAPTLAPTLAATWTLSDVAAPTTPLAPVDDTQWCVDSDDPRCSPDPVGAPSGHLAHAGDAGQAARPIAVAQAPLQVVTFLDRVFGHARSAVVIDLERPPQ